jgi:peptide/nickel transport system substrate-binding protein
LTRNNRPRTRLALAGTAVAAAAAVLLAGCTAGGSDGASGGTSSSSSSAAAKTVVVAYQNQVTTLDPSQTSYLQVDLADAGLYDTLVTFNAAKQLEPSLATAYTYNATSTSIAVTLRSGVKFHDGTTLTAKDVKYTLDRIKTIGTGIIGQIAQYKSSTVTDSTHLVINLTEPDTTFLSELGRIYIVNSALVQQHAGSDNGQSWLLNHDAGSGPYSLKTDQGGTFTLSRFAGYWGYTASRPQTMVLRRIDDLSTVRDELVAGTVNVGQVQASDAKSVSAAGLTVESAGSSEIIVWMNNAYGETKNPAVREALRLSYDYTGGLAKIRGGVGTVAAGPLPLGLSCQASLPTATQNLTEAKQVLAKAGIKNLTLTLRYQPAFSQQVQEATLLQSNLAQIGVKVNLQPIAFADYLTLLKSWKNIPELMLAQEGLPVPDPGTMLTQVYLSTSVGTNKAAYGTPATDALLNKAQADPDATSRCGLYKQAETLINQQNASMPLYTVTDQYGVSAGITGLAATTAGGSTDVANLRVGAQG